MKTKQVYESPQLVVTEMEVERGFTLSSTISDPAIEDEDPIFW